METGASLAFAKSLVLAAASGAAGLLLVDAAARWWKQSPPQSALLQVMFGVLVAAIAAISILTVYRSLIPGLSAVTGYGWERSQDPSRTKSMPPVDRFDLFRKSCAGLLLLALVVTALFAPYVSAVFAQFSRVTTILIVLFLWLGGGIAVLLRRRESTSSSAAFRWDLRSPRLSLRIAALVACSAVAASVVGLVYVLVVDDEQPTALFVAVGVAATILLAIILYDLPAPTAPRSLLRDAFRS